MKNNRFALTPSTPSTTTPTTRSALVRFAESVLSGNLSDQLLVSTQREQARAYLANTALENIGALSMLEKQLVDFAPLSKERCDLIIEAYALASAQKIVRY